MMWIMQTSGGSWALLSCLSVRCVLEGTLMVECKYNKH